MRKALVIGLGICFLLGIGMFAGRMLIPRPSEPPSSGQFLSHPTDRQALLMLQERPVYGGKSAFLLSQQIQTVIQSKQIFEQNTRGVLLGAFTGQHIGNGMHIIGRETGLHGPLHAVMLAHFLTHEPLITEHMITKKIIALKESLEVLNVDVLALLEQNPNRLDTLLAHTVAIEEKREAGLRHMLELTEQISTLKKEYNDFRSLEKSLEKNFYEDTRKLLPQESYDAFEAYVEVRQEGVKFHAEFKALETLLSYYKKTQVKLETKYKTLIANKEALVKGVEVVNIKNMQEKLLFTEKEWREISGYGQ